MSISMKQFEHTQEVEPLRTDLHLPRRIFHLTSGVLVVLAALRMGSSWTFLGIVGGFLIFSVGFELLRLRSTTVGKWTTRFFHPLMRKGEEERISGIPYYALGVLVSFAFFPEPVAILAVLFLALGDPVAAVAGNLCKDQPFVWNRKFFHDFRPKSLSGSLACFSVCTVMSFFLLPFLFPTQIGSLWMLVGVSLVAGFCAAFGELFPLRTDDNLSLPLVAGALFWLFASFVGLVPGLVLQ